MNLHKIVRMALCGCLLYGHSLCGLDWFGYVADNISEQVTSIDVGPTTPNVFGGSVTVPSGDEPQVIAITPDATKAYVASSNPSSNTGVTVLDLTIRSAPTVITRIAVPDTNLLGIAITPDGTRAYVTVNNQASVVIIDIPQNTIDSMSPISVGNTPVGIAITPAGSPFANRAYVINNGDNSYSVIDLISNSVIATNTPSGPSAFVLPLYISITPDGTTAYVTNLGGQNVIKIDLAADPTTETFTPILSGLFTAPFALAITSDGQAAYVTNQSGTPGVVKIDLSTNALTPILGTFSNPQGIAITPDNKFAYVTNSGSDFLTVIDLADSSTTNIPNSSLMSPFGIAITPDQAPVALFTTTVEPSGSPTLFDASASSTQTGTIVTYQWVFGDGNTVTTSSPTVTHTYATVGTYTVTLTVTNSAGTSTTQTFTGQTVSNNGGPSATTSLTINVPLGPPADFRGKVKENIFATQTEYSHILKWKPSIDPTIVGYRLFQDGKLIKQVSATGPFRVTLHNQKPKKPIVYTLVSVNADHVESTVSTVTLP